MFDNVPNMFLYIPRSFDLTSSFHKHGFRGKRFQDNVYTVYYTNQNIHRILETGISTTDFACLILLYDQLLAKRHYSVGDGVTELGNVHRGATAWQQNLSVETSYFRGELYAFQRTASPIDGPYLSIHLPTVLLTRKGYPKYTPKKVLATLKPSRETM